VAEESTGCVGGSGHPCKPRLGGPYCTGCTAEALAEGYHYSAARSECLPCGKAELGWQGSLVLALLGGVVFIGPMLVVARRPLGRWLRGAVLARVWAQLVRLRERLAVSVKLLLSFYQVVTRIEVVYRLRLPALVQLTISYFSGIHFNIGLLPRECLGLGSFHQTLLANMLLPLAVILFVLPLASLGVTWLRSRRADASAQLTKGSFRARVLYSALSWGLPVTFFAYPVVSSLAFRAFDCECFDGGLLCHPVFALTPTSRAVSLPAVCSFLLRHSPLTPARPLLLFRWRLLPGC